MDLVIGLLVGLLAFLGSLLGHWISRRNAQEVDTWRKREETMRMLRWAAEMSADAERPWRSAAGIDILGALGESELLQDDDIELVRNITNSIATTMADAMEQGYPEGEHSQQEESP